MDYLDLIDRQGRIYDDLLMASAKVSPEAFVEPGPADGPSLRDLLVEALDAQRRFVHGVLLEGRHVPLRPENIKSPLVLGPIFGGFRLTLLDHVEGLTREDLAREVTLHDGRTGATVDDVLAHLILLDARLRGLVAERLRQLSVECPDLDLL